MLAFPASYFPEEAIEIRPGWQSWPPRDNIIRVDYEVHRHCGTSKGLSILIDHAPRSVLLRKLFLRLSDTFKRPVNAARWQSASFSRPQSESLSETIDFGQDNHLGRPCSRNEF